MFHLMFINIIKIEKYYNSLNKLNHKTLEAISFLLCQLVT